MTSSKFIFNNDPELKQSSFFTLEPSSYSTLSKSVNEDQDDDFIDDTLFESLKSFKKTKTIEKSKIRKQQQQQQQQQQSVNPTLKKFHVGMFWTENTPLKAESLKLLKELIPFYNLENLERLIVPRAIKSLGLQKKYILSNTIKSEIDGISLRAIEWLVTNYSKGTKIVLYNEKLKNRIDIHNAYENQSNHYKRNLFDPFCRHGRVFFTWKLKPLKVKSGGGGGSGENGDTISAEKKLEKSSVTTSTTVTSSTSSPYHEITLVTTVGQLNFMKWADENGVLGYARNHQEEIQNDMESILSQVSKEKKQFKTLGKTRKRKELTKAPNIYCSVYSVDTVLQLDPPTPDTTPSNSPVNSPR